MVLAGSTLNASSPGWLLYDGVDPYPWITYLDGLSVSGSAAIAEPADTAAGVGGDQVSGSGSISEGADTVSAAGTNATIATGRASILEGHDASVGIGVGVSTTHPAGDSRRRYGVKDGWRLRIFDTPQEAEAYKRALSPQAATKGRAARKLRITPAHTVELQTLKADAASVGQSERYASLLASQRFHEMANLWHEVSIRIAAQRARQAARREEEEIAIILLHLH